MGCAGIGLGWVWGALGCVVHYVFGVGCGCWELAMSSPQRHSRSVISCTDPWLFDDIPVAAPGGCSCAKTADSVHWSAPFSPMVWSMPCLCVFTCSCSVRSAHKLRRCTPLGACLPPHCVPETANIPHSLLALLSLHPPFCATAQDAYSPFFAGVMAGGGERKTVRRHPRAHKH